MAIRITPSGEARVVTPAVKCGTFSLKELQTHVGGYVEVVPVFGHGDWLLLLVDEEGLQKRLPHNSGASLLAARPIVGNALLLTMDEWYRDDLGSEAVVA